MSIARAKTLAAALPGMGSPILRRLARGGFWSLAGDAGARGLALASAIVVARGLGVIDYGAFTLVQTTLGMMMIFATFGLGHTSTRYVAACRNAEPGRIDGIVGLTVSLAFMTGLAASLALFTAAPGLAARLLGAPELAAQLRLVAPALTLFAVSGAMSGTILGFEAFLPMARLTWLAGLVSFLSVVSGVWMWGLTGAVAGLVLAELVRCLLLTTLAASVMRQNGFRSFGRADPSEARVLWQFSLPLLLGAALHAPVLWICQAMLAQREGGMAEIGIYDAAQKWMTVVILAPFAASAAFGPVLANVGGEGGHAAVRRTTGQLALAQLALTALPAAIVAAASPWLVRIFGASFQAAAPVVVVTMALAPVFVLKDLYWKALTSGGHAWAAFWTAVLWAAVAVGATWLWREGGAMGLAKSMLCAYGVTLAASMMLLEWIWRK